MTTPKESRKIWPFSSQKKAQAYFCELVPLLTKNDYFLRNQPKVRRIKLHKPKLPPERSEVVVSVER